MLTKQQKRLLSFIQSFQQENGISPSFEEMRHAMNQKSKSSVHTLLNGLIERGFVKKLTNRARALEIIKDPNFTSLAFSARETAPLIPKPMPSSNESMPSNMVSVSFLGGHSAVFSAKVFLSNPKQVMQLPCSLLSTTASSDLSAIQINGDSFKESGILDGDILYFEMGAAPKMVMWYWRLWETIQCI
ncbi:MAG: hypothetical protein H6925_06045 [Holosporaceae bacterium]|nr:MAG: hypothetical protein H6925_06045 [Holosporaceae bacterium]